MGLVFGLLFCLMGITGCIVSLRPQIAAALSPAAQHPEGCGAPIDWNRAEKQVKEAAHSDINRIYAPDGRDPRWHFRVTTDRPVIYNHVIYDVCAGKVLGTVNLAWMDWTVDLHHNLLSGRTGRRIGGDIALLILVSGLSGALLWLLGSPSLLRMMRVRPGPAMPRDLHRVMGLTAGLLLSLAAFTSLWLCFPRTMRGMLAAVMTMPPETARSRGEAHREPASKAGLSELIQAAQGAIPDGSIREIRLPESYGNVQIRMRRPGDFRSLGNNVVTIDSVSARVVAIDLYSSQPASGRLTQAMAGLHYGEWGGLWFRWIYAAAGGIAGALFVTGALMWLLPKRRKAAAPGRAAINEGTLASR